MNLENFNFVKDGAIRLPPGFRFQPTDEEIVFQYLLRKTFSCPLPASIIPELNVCNHDPWDLPGDQEQDKYFFSYKEPKYPNGNRSNRATTKGYWKPTGVDKEISSSKRKPIVGKRKTLVFYQGKPPRGTRTDWIMHEYRLMLTRNEPSSPQNSSVQIGHWVLCHIFAKKSSSRQGVEKVGRGKEHEAGINGSDVDHGTGGGYLMEADSSSSCGSIASDSSVLTEVSSSCSRSY